MNEAWQVGDRIEGRWEVHRVLKGGMGVVFVVYDHNIDAVYAAKTFQDEVFARTPDISKRFVQEASTWINLDLHENIVWAQFVESIRGKPYLFLEFVSGGDLSSWIGTPRLVDDLPQTLRFALQFCDGMRHALSKGIKAHRDIKPQNCLVTESGTLKVTDFGLAKIVADVETSPIAAGLSAGPAAVTATNVAPSSGARAGLLGRLFSSHLSSLQSVPANIALSKTGTAAGTCTHMAPEQFDDSKHVDVRADIYSFGIMLYQMASGKLPYVGRTWQDYEGLHKSQAPPLLQDLSGCLNDLIQSCLAKVPERRPSGFDVVRERLAELYEEQTGREPPTPRTGKRLDAIDYFNKGGSFGNLSKYDKALEAFDHCLALAHPEDEVFEQALVNRGGALLTLRRFDEALACFDKALKLRPDDEKAWFSKGSVFLERNALLEAERCYRKAVAINPGFDTAYCNLGAVLLRNGRADEALASFDRAVALNPRDSVNWQNKGECLKEMGRLREALECFDAAINAEPRNAMLWFNKGVVLGQLGDTPGELRCYDRAIELDPNDIESWLNKGVTLSQQGRHPEAIDCYDQALKTSPNFVEALKNKGASLLLCDRQSEAIACFDRALDQDPQLAGAWLLKGRALLETGRVQDALASYEEALRLGKENARDGIEECRRRLVTAPAPGPKKGRSDMSPEDPSDYYNLAIRSIQQGNRVAAVNYYLKALNALDEEKGNSRAFKAFIAYQCGVCVLKHYEMEGVDPRRYTKEQRDGAEMIRKLWGSTVRLATTLGPEDLGEGFGAMLPRAVRSIMDDSIMK